MIFTFNQFTLDTGQYRLASVDGEVSVEPLVFDLLVYLVEHRDRVVSREELLENLWAGKVVTDSALGARLKDARKVVCDNGSRQEVIKTVHGRGYQFIAAVSVVEPDDPVGQLEAGAVSPEQPAPASTKASIAVLPFNNLSNDRDQEYFSDGITEDIITELSRFRTIVVTARNTSFRFKGESVDIKEVGAKLGVQYILEGSVRRAGNRVRITAQLAECETGNHIWAERYDSELDDIFELQDEVTKSIVAVLPGRVEIDVADRSLRKPTENKQAYELMMQAKAYRDLLSAEGNIKVRLCCEKALALDPHFARAYMYYSDSCIVDIWWGIADDESYRLALEYARKAIALDPNDMFIQDHLGFALLSHQQWQEAEAQFDKTLPKITHEVESMAWIGYANLLLDHREKARDIVLEAMQRNPQYRPTLDWVLGQIYFFEERYEDVVKLLAGEALLNALAHGLLAGAYAHLGRKQEAKVALTAFIHERHSDYRTRDIIVKESTVETLAGSFRAMWRNPASWEKLASGLVKAGLSV